MNTMRMMFLAAALALTASCAKEATDQPAPTDQTQPAPAPAPAQIPDEELPVATDFEDEAEQQITTDSYKGELDKLEQEIAAE